MPVAARAEPIQYEAQGVVATSRERETIVAEKRQVVIVGASYGGLIAGALLAEAGMDTLLIDENDLVGQPGGAVPYNGYWIDWSHRDARGTRDCLMVNF